METKQTLASIFEANKQALERELSNLVLPTDAEKIQDIVCQHLKTMFEDEGVYRQSLNQAEDYVLMAAIELLYVQQNIAKEIVETAIWKATSIKKQIGTKQTTVSPEIALTTSSIVSGLTAGLGSWTGKSIGGSLLGVTANTWGAIIGAIVGTAIVLYGTLTLSNTQQPEEPQEVNVQIFINIVKSICEKIDGLMETFRVQVKRIKNEYERQEKPSLQKDYSILLNCIQDLVVLCSTSYEDKEKKLARIEQKVEILSSSLENYGLSIVNGQIIKID